MTHRLRPGKAKRGRARAFDSPRPSWPMASVLRPSLWFEARVALARILGAAAMQTTGMEGRPRRS